MALYEVGWNISTAAAAAPLGGAWNTNTTRVIWIREIGIFIAATAVAADVGIGRYATRGTQTTTTLGQAQDPADVAAAGTVDQAWSAGTPTAPTFMRKISLPATVGAGVIWTWPPSGNSKGLKVAGGAGLLLWSATNSTVARCYVVFDE